MGYHQGELHGVSFRSRRAVGTHGEADSHSVDKIGNYEIAG